MGFIKDVSPIFFIVLGAFCFYSAILWCLS